MISVHDTDATGALGRLAVFRRGFHPLGGRKHRLFARGKVHLLPAMR